jgi:hypothetical protein
VSTERQHKAKTNLVGINTDKAILENLEAHSQIDSIFLLKNCKKL